MKYLTFVFNLPLLAGGLGACQDNNDDGPPPFESGVDHSKEGEPVSTLRDDDLRTFCDSFETHVQNYVDLDQASYVACLPAAIVLGRDAQHCQALLDNCMRVSPSAVSVEVRLADRDGCIRDLRECDASVHSLEECIDTHVDIAVEVRGWSCAGATDDVVRQHAYDVMGGRVCQTEAPCERFSTVEVI